MAIGVPHDMRDGRKGRESFGQHNGAGPRATPAMRRGEGFVQINVHRIHAQIPRADTADNRVEVRAIAIDIAARRVDRVGNALQIPLKQAAGVGIGDHHSRNIGAKTRGQRGKVDTAFGCGGNAFHAEASKGGRRRVGAMR